MKRLLGLLALALAAAGAASAAPGQTDYQIRFWQTRLERDADDPISPIELAWAYAQKARECGDAAYYLRAERALRKSLERGPGNYRALATLAWVEVGEHRFREAGALAEWCVTIHPRDPFNYGTLGDAKVELGEYDASGAAIRRMLALQRGMPAYARMAYQRELHGDRQAALRLMQQAAAAADPTDAHSRAWCATQLGDLLLKGGALREAGRQVRRGAGRAARVLSGAVRQGARRGRAAAVAGGRAAVQPGDRGNSSPRLHRRPGRSLRADGPPGGGPAAV